MNDRRNSVSAELALGLLGPERTIVPLMASVHYDSRDPYAVRMAFHVASGDPVEWTLARDLLAAALHSSQGIGDVRAWPSAAPASPAAAGAAHVGAAAGRQILNIAMSSPFGHAQFEASAAAMAEFLDRTYKLVPLGEESGFLDFDAELTNLLGQS